MIPVRAAISKNLRVSVLLGTNVPELMKQLVTNPTTTEDGQALVVTRAQSQKIARVEEDMQSKMQRSEVEPIPVGDGITTTGPCIDPPAFSEL